MIVLLHISILILDKLSRKGIENRRSGMIFISNMLDSEVLFTKPLKNTLLTGPKVQVCYTQGGRQGFSLGDGYNVRPLSGKSRSCHADALNMFCKQIINIQFVLQCTCH